jgi:hypothetical protein
MLKKLRQALASYTSSVAISFPPMPLRRPGESDADVMARQQANMKAYTEANPEAFRGHGGDSSWKS